jgi:hypothetical protein
MLEAKGQQIVSIVSLPSSWMIGHFLSPFPSFWIHYTSSPEKYLTLIVMNRLQTSGELQDKTSFIDPSTDVDLLKSCSPYYLLL